MTLRSPGPPISCLSTPGNHGGPLARGAAVLITALTVQLAPAAEQLVELGRPWLTPRTPSDDWFYATLFSATCPGRRQSREGVRLECLV